MNTYECFYAGKRWTCEAETSYAAHQKALEHWSPPKSKRHQVFVLIVEKKGEPVTHQPGELG